MSSGSIFIPPRFEFPIVDDPPPDEAAMLARELPIKLEDARHRLDVLGHSPERVRAEVALEAVGLPVPHADGRWVFWSPRGNGESLGSWLRWGRQGGRTLGDVWDAIVRDWRSAAMGGGPVFFDLDAPATIATHPELECWSSRDPR